MSAKTRPLEKKNCYDFFSFENRNYFYLFIYFNQVHTKQGNKSTETEKGLQNVEELENRNNIMERVQKSNQGNTR